jgi:phosphoserine phosphatase
MKLLIVRHGESEENSLGILQGLLPGTLNDTGKKQCEELGEKLALEKIDIVYCSPVNRCLETLTIVKKYIDPNIPIVINNLIAERDFGQMSGKSWSEISFDELDVDSKKNQLLGVESLESVSNRAKEFLAIIKDKHVDQTVLVVSHSNTIRMMLTHILNMTFADVLKNIKIKNAALNVYNLE